MSKECYYQMDSNGLSYAWVGDSPYVDWQGNPVKNTPSKAPYSYDAYVIHKEKQEYQHVVYSDRLRQWDSKKHDDLCFKHFGNTNQYWDNRKREKIEAFLQDYYGVYNLKLVGVMKGCNVSSGYPYWIFFFDAELENK